MSERTLKKGLVDDGYCFACGPLNPLGLRMKVSYHDEKASSRLALRREFQGWNDVIHGGVIATLLDEIMAHAVLRYVGKAVTTSLKITYRLPLHVGEEVLVTGQVEEKTRRGVTAFGKIQRTEDDKNIATAESRFLLLR